MTNIFRDGMLVDIDIGLPTTIDPELIKKFRSVEGKARRAVDNNSFVFPIGSSRFVPKKILDHVIKELEDCKKEYEVITNELIDNMEFREKFHISWNLYEIAIPDKPDPEDDFEIKKYRDTQSNINEFLKQAIVVLRGDVIATCSRILSNIDKKYSVKGQIIGALDNMCDRFINMNFYGESFEDKFVSLKDFMERYPPKRIREDMDIRSDFVKRIQELRDICRKSNILEAIERYRKSFA